jgi:hypothetical protein
MFTTSNYQELYWPTANTDDIASPQTLVANTPLNLNGRFSNQNTYKNIDFSYNNKLNASVVRKLTFTSGDDMSGTEFVIYGRQNDVDIIENITGPNGNTVTSDNYYDYIYKIEHTGVVAGNVSIGTDGNEGFFTLATLDVKNYRKSLEYGINFVIDPQGGANVEYNIFGSLNRKRGLYQDLIDKKYFYKLFDAEETTTEFFNITIITALILIKVFENGNNYPLTAQILQI